MQIKTTPFSKLVTKLSLLAAIMLPTASWAQEEIERNNVLIVYVNDVSQATTHAVTTSAPDGYTVQLESGYNYIMFNYDVDLPIKINLDGAQQSTAFLDGESLAPQAGTTAQYELSEIGNGRVFKAVLNEEPVWRTVNFTINDDQDALQVIYDISTPKYDVEPMQAVDGTRYSFAIWDHPDLTFNLKANGETIAQNTDFYEYDVNADTHFEVTVNKPHTYTVMSVNEITGSEWDPTNTAADMTTTDNRNYTLTLTNLTLPAGEYQYVICQDHGWEVIYPSGENAILYVPREGKYDVTFHYTVGDDKPSATIKPAEGETFVCYYPHLVPVQGATKDISFQAYDDGIWTAPLGILLAEPYTIYITGSDGSSYDNIITPSVAGASYQLNFDEASKDISVSVEKLTLSVVGHETLVGVDWSAENTTCDMTTDDGIHYTATRLNLDLAAGTDYEYKVCQDHSWFPIYPENSNIVLTVPADGTYNVTFCYTLGDAEPTHIVSPSVKETTLAANAGSDHYYITFSDQQAAHEITAPDGKTVLVYDVKVTDGKMNLIERTGCKVAKGEGVLLWSDSPTLTASTLTEDVTASQTTDLVATPAIAGTIAADEGYKLYRLTYDNIAAKTGLGFYYGVVKNEEDIVESNDGSRLNAIPGKAYLRVAATDAIQQATGRPAEGFPFAGEGNQTGIATILEDSQIESQNTLDLTGRKVGTTTKGLYIQNGKKIIIK